MSALESIELLLVEVSEPVVVNLVGITESLSAELVAKTVGHEGSCAKDNPLAGSQLSVPQVSEVLGSCSEESSETKTDDTELSCETKSTTLSFEESILREQVFLGAVDDLISGGLVLSIDVSEVPVVDVSKPVASHC